MAIVMDECAQGLEKLIPSLDSIQRPGCVLPAFCERVPDMKPFRYGGQTSSLSSDAALTTACEGEQLTGSGQSGTSSQRFTHQERTWRDLERTVIGNEVKWICTMLPTTPKSSEMSMHCPSDDTVEPEGGADSALDHACDSPTSTLTADTDRDNGGGAISNRDGVHALPYPKLEVQALDQNLLDFAERLISDGYSLCERKPSSPFPMTSSKFEATEDCNSSGSCASDHQWSGSSDLPTFDGIAFQEPCDILGPVPMFTEVAEHISCLSGMHDGLEDHISDSCLLREAAHVGEKLSSYVAEDKEGQGVELVQQLLACAEAISGGEMSAAQQHLKRLEHLICARGSSMERVATYFTKALSAWLDGELLGYHGSNNDCDVEPSTIGQKLIAYQMFYTSCPYLIVTHFTANQAILEAFEGEERVHVVDLDIKQGLQWPSLIQALSERLTGPPRLRITGVAGDSFDMKSLMATKKRLLDFADLFNVPLEFTVIKANYESLQPWELGIRENEALAVNCVSCLHKLVGDPRVSIDNFLLMIHSLKPSVVTVVEQDANHDGEFLPRFMNALHYYSSMFDSVAASCISSSPQDRETVERLLLGMDIMDIVGMEGKGRLERHQTADLWIRRMTQLGFQLRPLSSRSFLQANYLLSMYPDSKYCLTNQECYLSVGWQEKPLYCVSSWC